MPLYRPFSSFTLENMEQYQELCLLLDRQIEEICNEANVFLTQVAVKEALNNAIEHGSFPIKVEFANLPTGEFSIKVIDQGDGFLVAEKLELIRKVGIDQLLEDKLYDLRGRGILIMLKTVREVLFNEKGNEVILTVTG